MNNQLVLKQSVIAVALTLATTQAALAQQTATSSTPTVYVTGSNLKRTSKEGPAPVQVITSKDIRDSGATTVTELMRLVPSMGSDQNLDTNDGGFSRGAATASLRGLSSSATLVLLNGRRMTPAAYADPNNGNSTLYDLNAIPLSALDRVEILKDGASAVYGSDAVGGVINFITKNNYQGLEVSARYSANDAREFGRKGVNFFWGKGDVDNDGYNVFITADVSKRDRVLRADVTDIHYERYRVLNNRYATPYGSTVSASPAFYRESAPGSGIFTANRTNMASRLVVTTNCDPSQRLVGATNMGLPATSVFIGREFCNYNTNRFLEGSSAGEDGSLMSRGVLKLGGGMKAFAEVAFTRNERDYTGSPITIGQGVTTNFSSQQVVAPFQAILEIGHPDNPFPSARSSVGYRFENLRGGTRSVNENTRFVTGLQGTAGTWDWETALLYNQTKRDELYYGRLYLPTLRTLNTGTSLAQLAQDPTLSRDVLNKNKAAILHLDVKANTTFGQLAGGAMGLAMGAEVRRETLKMTPDAVLASGQIFGLANSAIDGERDIKSAFVELRTPFLKNFEMDFAARVDKYPDIKANFVPKIGAKWDVTSSFSVRGTYARGFRAPALNQVTPGGSQFFESGIRDPRRCNEDLTPKPGASEVDCNKTAGGVGNANPDLLPEKSKSFSLGILYSPTTGIDFGIDMYKIRKEGEVVLASAFDVLRDEDANPGVIQRDQNPLTLLRDANGNAIPGTGPLLFVRLPWSNQGATEVQGVDFDAAFRHNMGEWGSFSAKMTSSYLYKYTIAQESGDVEHNLAGSNAGLADWNLSSGIDLPRWKNSFTASLSRGAHAFSASINYTGSVSMLRKYDKDTTYAKPFCHFGMRQGDEPNRAAGNPFYEASYPKCKVNSWTRFGVGYTYTGIENLTLSLNIQNLFDTPAPYDPNFGASTTTGAPLAGYNEGLHNPYGRYFSVVAKYVF